MVVVSSSLISDYFTGLDKSRVMDSNHFVNIGGALIAKGSGNVYSNGRMEKRISGIFNLYSIVLIVLATVPKGEVTKQRGEEGKSRNLKRNGLFWTLCLVTGIFVAIS